jgi:hypothetical protein
VRPARLALAFLTALAMAGRARPAPACSCNAYPAFSPADGSVGVPLNVSIIVVDYGGLTLETDGATVATTTEEHNAGVARSMVELRPAADLLPQTTYSIRTYGTAISTFTTGDAADLISPTTTIRDFQIRLAAYETAGTCSSFMERIYLDVPSDVEIAVYLVDFEPAPVVSSAAPVYVMPAELPEMGASCHPSFLFDDGTICLHLTPIDIAGNRGPPAIACTLPLECDAVADAYDIGPLENCMPADERTDGGCSAGPGSHSLALVAVLLLLRSSGARRRRLLPRRDQPAPPPAVGE